MGATTGVSGDGAAGAAQPEPIGQPARRRVKPDAYRPAHRLAILWRSTIGKKYVAAVTGLVLAIFVVLHMAGNLKAIEGAGGGHPALDRYAHFLRTVGSPVLPHDFALWLERIALLAALVLHLIAITQLWRRNRRAQPPAHRARRVRSTIAARTMPYTGVLILGFVIFHILHFTTRTIHPTPLIKGAVYANAYGAFHRWWLVVIYVGVVVLLGFHINHGLWSGAQTAGVDNPDRNWFWRRLATAVTLLTVVGFALVPILFATGALPKPVSP
jgi:succinate dehydrogenase / fumarate reductase cytochrome b subunit